MAAAWKKRYNAFLLTREKREIGACNVAACNGVSTGPAGLRAS